MSNWTSILIIFGLIIAVVLIVVFWLWSVQNRLVALRNRAGEAWSDVTVQLKRRADLLPNLVSAVKGYAAHEQSLFRAVTDARAATARASNPAEAQTADGEVRGAIKSLFAVAEGYPQLQASANFLQLQTELVDTEDRIQAARRFYNGSARDLNTAVQQFPANLVARGFGVHPIDFFQTPDAGTIVAPPRIEF